MRPRSRLLAKRGLPTIREGYEELVQDLNQTNSQHSSTQDYFLSICQLARPAFPLPEPDCDILSIGTLDSPKPCLHRLHRLRQPPQLSQTLLPGTGTGTGTSGATRSQRPSSRGDIEEDTTMPASSDSPHSHAQLSEQDRGGNGDRPGSNDPLEYLYGPRGAVAAASSSSSSSSSSSCSSSRIAPHRERSDSFPRPCSAPSLQRKSSCPELRLVDLAVPSSAALLQRSPVSRKKLDFGGTSANKPDGAPPGWRGKSGGGRVVDKQTMVSHWIAECRSAWREARVRACMLPAIAEK